MFPLEKKYPMNTNVIPIKIITEHLGIRIPRILQKVEKLNLTIIELEEGQAITKSDALLLLDSYSTSAKVGASTKVAAEQLTELISNNETTTILSSMRIPTDVPSKKTRKKNKRSLVNTKWTKTLYRLVHTFIQYLITSCTQTIEFCVHGLTSVHFRFIALFVAVAVQMHHSAEWFYRIQPSHSMLTAYGYAFMVDLFILVVTFEGKRSIARTFAWLTFLSNVLYFQFWVAFDYSIQAYTNALSSIIVSATIAYIIFAYTELFVKYHNTETIFTPSKNQNVQ